MHVQVPLLCSIVPIVSIRLGLTWLLCRATVLEHMIESLSLEPKLRVSIEKDMMPTRPLELFGLAWEVPGYHQRCHAQSLHCASQVAAQLRVALSCLRC